MQVIPVRCLRDNFSYLVTLQGASPGEVAVVDPGEAGPVLAALEARGLVLHQIWATHHHPDHVGGVKELMTAFPEAEVVAHRADADKVQRFAPAGRQVRRVEDGDEVRLGGLRASVLHNPGHTLGGISYLVRTSDPADAGAPALFTGDTLFGAGCGRLFEGDAAMMYASLAKLAALPDETRVYFGHEYTRANLRFAQAVTPDDRAVASRLAEVDELLSRGADTTPSTMALERATNPFLRCTEPAVISMAQSRGPTGSPVEVFAALRAWKDSF
jgi:hydroxyacylglutathione hydrolase